MRVEDDDQPVDPRFPGGRETTREALLRERAAYEAAGKTDRVAQVDAYLAELFGASEPSARAVRATSRAVAGAEKR